MTASKSVSQAILLAAADEAYRNILTQIFENAHRDPTLAGRRLDDALAAAADIWQRNRSRVAPEAPAEGPHPHGAGG